VSVSAHKRVRLAVLLTCLGALVLYALATRTDLLHGDEGVAQGSAVTGLGVCSGRTPSVVNVGLWQLAELRASLLQVSVLIGGRRYAEGAVSGENAWSDEPPQSVGSSAASLSGGYEVRWWASNGDDVVADVFQFAGPRQARGFFRSATNPRCRYSGTVSVPPWLLVARNLVWVNPDRFTQEDVYVVRGSRVYRIADVRARNGRRPRLERRIAFLIVDSLACILPEADCRTTGYRARPRSGPRSLTASLDRQPGPPSPSPIA
jgi:hypothetical protein